MALFLSTFINKLDKKGRVSVPATFRTALSNDVFQGFVAFRSYKNAAIECFTYDRMTQLSASVDSFDVFSDAQDDFATAIFADAVQIAIDGDGRISLPQELMDHGAMTQEVAFVGRGPTFQLWNPETFADMQSAARERMRVAGVGLKLGGGS